LNLKWKKIRSNYSNLKLCPEEIHQFHVFVADNAFAVLSNAIKAISEHEKSSPERLLNYQDTLWETFFVSCQQYLEYF
jgi:hypothetical protein